MHSNAPEISSSTAAIGGHWPRQTPIGERLAGRFQVGVRAQLRRPADGEEPSDLALQGFVTVTILASQAENGRTRGPSIEATEETRYSPGRRIAAGLRAHPTHRHAVRGESS